MVIKGKWGWGRGGNRGRVIRVERDRECANIDQGKHGSIKGEQV